MLFKARNFESYYSISMQILMIPTFPIAHSSPKWFLMPLNEKWESWLQRCRYVMCQILLPCTDTQFLQVVISCICYTTDMWSNLNLIGYLAITTHYYIQDKNSCWKKRSYLVAFQHVQGKHSGANMASYFFPVLGELGIMHKVNLTS